MSSAEAGVGLQEVACCVMYAVVRPSSIWLTSASARSPALANLVGNPWLPDTLVQIWVVEVVFI